MKHKVILLLKLTANSTGHGQARVNISEEPSRILLNESHLESIAGIRTSSHIDLDPSLERPLKTTLALANALAVVNGVGECDSIKKSVSASIHSSHAQECLVGARVSVTTYLGGPFLPTSPW